MSKKKKFLLTVILAVVGAGHVWLFAAGGSWRTAGFALLVVDVITGFMVIGALQEFKKLEKK
jgi:prepilin signal peptidase PulO-like enzyme (type II secretory pathway)